MPTERYKAEQIMTPLRQVEVVIANGQTTTQACREAGVSEQAFYRWRKSTAAKRLKVRSRRTSSPSG
jgi:transposase